MHKVWLSFFIIPSKETRALSASAKSSAALNHHFFKMPNPPTFLKPSLSKEEIEYCVNDCLFELELFARLTSKLL
jgi:hypothetical protein